MIGFMTFSRLKRPLCRMTDNPGNHSQSARVLFRQGGGTAGGDEVEEKGHGVEDWGRHSIMP